ncbi:MAG: ComF family protein [Clostridia bacterium]|nr:ComF family protein [Clostridia bacterium]
MRLFQRILNIFFPRRCIYCDAPIDTHVRACKHCLPVIPEMVEPFCRRCGRTKELCRCKGHRRHFETAVAAMQYVDGAKRAVLFLKRHDDADVIATMAQEMVAALRARTDAAAIDVVTFVPMCKEAKRDRGFNQSELLAKDVARELGVPFKPLLVKLYDTAAQKSLPMVQRSGNVLGVFDVVERVDEQRILIVDDLITTGATLHECAKMLKVRGAACVTVLTFAGSVPNEETEDETEESV